jgi:hypothetical protein
MVRYAGCLGHGPEPCWCIGSILTCIRSVPDTTIAERDLAIGQRNALWLRASIATSKHGSVFHELVHQIHECNGGNTLRHRPSFNPAVD